MVGMKLTQANGSKKWTKKKANKIKLLPKFQTPIESFEISIMFKKVKYVENSIIIYWHERIAVCPVCVK